MHGVDWCNFLYTTVGIFIPSCSKLDDYILKKYAVVRSLCVNVDQRLMETILSPGANVLRAVKENRIYKVIVLIWEYW